jgi:hypothetical protein
MKEFVIKSLLEIFVSISLIIVKDENGNSLRVSCVVKNSCQMFNKNLELTISTLDNSSINVIYNDIVDSQNTATNRIVILVISDTTKMTLYPSITINDKTSTTDFYCRDSYFINIVGSYIKNKDRITNSNTLNKYDIRKALFFRHHQSTLMQLPLTTSL